MDNKYGVYRQIRYNRTYRTLGRMTWWRIALGAVLLLSVLFISGFVSVRVAMTGHFKTADTLMVDSFMETYRPTVKAYIEAGVLYDEGDYAAALEAFRAVETAAAAEDNGAGTRADAAAMRSLAALRLAQERYEAGAPDLAREALAAVDAAQLDEANAAVLETLTALLGEG